MICRGRFPILVSLLLALAADARADKPETKAPEAATRPAKTVKTVKTETPPTATTRAPIVTAPSPVPQNRFTVQKHIESIEPIEWLRRFGAVEVKPRNP